MSNTIGFWEDNYTPSFAISWKDIPNYSKFTNVGEMHQPEAFLALLVRNENLRNTKSYRELKAMAKKYADECIEAENAAQDKTSERYFQDMKQQYGDSLSALVRERSCAMDEEEIRIFMEYVRNAEWLQYVEQTEKEIFEMLMNNIGIFDEI